MSETTFRYFETGSTDPYYNLAFEEYVFDHFEEGDILILWQNDNTVVIGKNQITAQQVNAPFIEAHKVNVVRRMTGGGAVYHDLGNLNYSFITDDDGEDVSSTLEVLARPIVEALKGLGLDAEVSGRNDILIGGRKVSGTAQRVAHDRILHHGTLLFEANKEMVAGALKVDQEKFRGKGIKSVSARIGNIRDFLIEQAARGTDGAETADGTEAAGDGETEAANTKADGMSPEEIKSEGLPVDINSFWAYLRGALPGADREPVRLSSEALAAIEELADTKYRTYEWNYGRSPRFESSSRRYLPGGLLETFVNVRHDRIEAVRFHGDFLARKSLDEIEQALVETRYERTAVAEVLRSFKLNQYFGDITADEIVNTLFGEE